MSTLPSPGVYVFDQPSPARPIAGVGTSTAGFIGVVENDVTMPDQPDGTAYTVTPEGEQKLITNFEEFRTKFGEVGDKNRVLASAVFGFFSNGGTRCWVIRLASLDGPSDGNPDTASDALKTFETIDEIAIVAIPCLDTGAGAPDADRRKALRKMTLGHCENMKDRFAVLDGESTVDERTPEKIYPGSAGAMGDKSEYGALYWPWLNDLGGNTIPPCGHIAGIYARVDATRGVHKAPANEGIRGVLSTSAATSKSIQDGLNPTGVNVIRTFRQTGIRVWGARTIGGDANGEMKYVSTRRFLNFLRESIDEGTQFVVFEPNTPSLWQRVKRSVSDFLLAQWRAGALFGATPEQAFFVRCDEETNPPDVREAGQVVTEIGVAITKPAEFVVFRVQQITGG